MLVKTEGIVLRTIKYSETSIITKIFTRELGLQSYLVKGVRGEKSKNKAVVFLPGNILEIDVYKRNNKDLQFLKEFRFKTIYGSITFHIIKSSMMIFMIEVLNKALKEEETNESLYEFIESTFLQLDKTEPTKLNFHLHFLMQLTAHLGFIPTENYDNANCFFDLSEGIFLDDATGRLNCLDKQFSSWVNDLLTHKNLEGINNHSRETLLNHILQYYSLHLPNFSDIKSHKILHEVLH
jgi:DNA repair protein RecO (recombination protein O)